MHLPNESRQTARNHANPFHNLNRLSDLPKKLALFLQIRFWATRPAVLEPALRHNR
jgi:hypothetical protein